MPEELQIHCEDGFALSTMRFEPAAPGDITVLINSATGVKQKFYVAIAEFFNRHGIRVYTYDYRGIGRSRPHTLAGFKASMADWGEKDQTAMIRHLLDTHPRERLIILGHSVGGQIIGLSPLSQDVDKLVMIAAQTPYWKNYRGATRFRVWMLWHVLIPLFTPAAGYFPARRLGLFEDLPAATAQQWARWGKNRGYMFPELPHMKTRYHSLRHNALFLSFDDDPFAPQDAAIDLMKIYSGVTFDHRHIFPRDLGVRSIGHWNFFRTPVGESLWPAVVEWIRRPAGRRELTVDSRQ